MSQAVEHLIKQASQNHSRKLDLSNHELTELPEAVFSLNRLEYLDLSENHLAVLPPGISQLSRLTRLSLAGNAFTTLPQELTHLINLELLYLSHNPLAQLPPDFGNLTNLETLYLYGNRLEELPDEITECKMLGNIGLGGNRLERFPMGLTQLHRLTRIDLSKNRLAEIPKEIDRLEKLQELDLSDNWLDSLPSSFPKLTNLRTLYLSRNRFTKLPENFATLTSLAWLFLSDNDLAELPVDFTDLVNLEVLYLSGNRLESLPKGFPKLSRLTKLQLFDNQLAKLPTGMEGMTHLQTLNLKNNPLPIPLEILEKTGEPNNIINYYNQHQQGEKKPLNEAKVVLVGEGGVGKTSLVNRLLDGEFDPHENKTDGIDIRRWLVDSDRGPIRLNVWDFGGQEIMHATHQFFLTKRTLYLLVLNARQGDEDNRLEYWLKIIQSFAGDSPVIVVGNKSDQNPLDLNWRGLQKKYPNIVHFARGVSCKSGNGVEELREQIEKEVHRLPHIQDELLASWFEVKEELENMDADFIPDSSYQEMCRRRRINEQSRITLINFLHDLGIVLSFRDHPVFEGTNILNPEWVTGGVYQILNDHELFLNKGRMKMSDLERILDPIIYPRDKHPFIIHLMRRFELCVEFVEAEETYLVPDLLPKEEPDTGNWDDCISLQYHYDILPSSVISRFMVRMHIYISKRTYWRTGVVLISEDTQNRALVKADTEDRKVYIYVAGRDSSRRNFLEIIRADFRRIHRSISQIQVTEMVPIPDHDDIVVSYKHLRLLEERGHDFYIPDGLDEEISVSRLLNGLEPEESRSGPIPGEMYRDRKHTKIAEEQPGASLKDQNHIPFDPDDDALPREKAPPSDQPNSVWKNGSFYLFTFVVVFGMIFFILQFMNLKSEVLPFIIALGGGIASMAIIGAFQQHQDGKISENGFLSLINSALNLVKRSGSEEEEKK